MLKIYKTLKEMSKDNDKNVFHFSCYVQDANIRVQLFANCLYITDLTNALKRGKECRKTVITYSESTVNNFAIELKTKYLYPNNKDFADLIEDIQNFYVSDLHEAGFDVELREEKASTVFSPFADIKPIKLPKNGKWTKSHVVKAIITGQIYKGEIDGIYTDDYYSDAKENFQRDRNLNLIEMAQTLVENGEGWTVRLDKDNALKVNCYTFNCNTLYFNIDSRKDNIEYIEVAKEDIQDQTTIIDNSITVIENVDNNSKVINLFNYKQQKQDKQQELFNKLLSCNSLEDFKYLTENHLQNTKQNYIITNDKFSPQMMDKLEFLCKGDIVKMIECFDILKYFRRSEELKTNEK